MKRRDLLQWLAVSPVGFLFKSRTVLDWRGEIETKLDADSIREVLKTKVDVLEAMVEPARYVTKWEFNTELEAVKFVRSLQPKLIRVWTPRFPSSEITHLHCVIVRKDDPEKVEAAGWTLESGDVFPFWSLGTAWAYLMNIRVNGKPVSRRINEFSMLSEYMVEPFNANTGKVEIHRDKDFWQLPDKKDERRIA